MTADKPNLLVETLPAVWTWQVDDVTAPNTLIETAPAPETNGDLPSLFVFSSNELGVYFECALDPVGVPVFTSCASPPENTAEFSPEPGVHTLHVRAVDPSLNADPTPVVFTWTVVGPALTTIAADVPAAPATTTRIRANFAWTSNQAGVTYMCSLDGVEFAPCTSPVALEDLALGGHTFEVQSTNRFLHVESPPAIFEWSIELPPDVELPETTITEAPLLDPSTSRSAMFRFTSNPFGSGFECKLDLGPWEAVHLAQDLRRSPRRRAHLPGAGDRPLRDPGSGPGGARVDRRRGARDDHRLRGRRA